MREARTPETHADYFAVFRDLQRSGEGHINRSGETQLDQFWIERDCTPDTDDWAEQNDALASVLKSHGGQISGVMKLKEALGQHGFPRTWSEVTFWEHLDGERILCRPLPKAGRWHKWEFALRSTVHCVGCLELI